MPQFYVPVQVKPAELLSGLPAHSNTNRYPHYDNEKQAQAYLNTHQYPAPYYKDAAKGEKEPMVYGPNKDIIQWPSIYGIYRVGVEEPDKLDDMKRNAIPQPFISKEPVGRTMIDPTKILSRTTIIGADPLHPEPVTIYDEPVLGEKLSDEKIRKVLEERSYTLERMYKILERSNPDERQLLDMNNKEHLDIMQRVCGVTQPGESLSEKTLMEVLRQIGNTAGITTVLSSVAIQAEFNAQLEAMPASVPEEERVAIAMSGTLQKFAASVPVSDSPGILKIANNIPDTVHGIVNELAEEQKAETITGHEDPERTDYENPPDTNDLDDMEPDEIM